MPAVGRPAARIGTRRCRRDGLNGAESPTRVGVSSGNLREQRAECATDVARGGSGTKMLQAIDFDRSHLARARWRLPLNTPAIETKRA